MANFMTGFASAFNDARARTEEKQEREKERAERKAERAEERTYYEKQKAADQARDDRIRNENRQNQLTDQQTGFARADAIRADENRLQKANSQFQATYPLLMKNVEKREQKQAQENEWAKQAQLLGNGDSTLATSVLPYLRAGNSFEQVQKMIDSGQFVKNDKYVAPTQKLVMPMAVTNPMSATDAASPARADATPKKIDLLPKGLEPEARDQLLQMEYASGGPLTYEEVKEPTDTGTDNLAYKYQPKDVYEVGDLNNVLMEKKAAEASGDPAAIRRAQWKYEVTMQARAMNQQDALDVARLRASGKDQDYMIIDPKTNKPTSMGLVSGRLVDDPDNPSRKVLMNMNNPAQPQIVDGIPVLVDDFKKGKYFDLRKEFAVKSADLNAGMTYYKNSLSSAKIMTDILDRNPDAATNAADMISKLQNLGGDVATAWKVVNDAGTKLEADALSGNIPADEMEKRAKDYNDQVSNIASEIWNSSINSPDSQKLAFDSVMYKAARTNLAINLATAKGLSQSKMSDQDFKNMIDTLGGEGAKGAKAKGAIFQALKEGRSYLDSTRMSINSDPRIRNFKQDFGFATDMEAPRMEQFLMDAMKENAELRGGVTQPEDLALLQYFQNLNSAYEAETQRAGQEAHVQAGGFSTNAPTQAQGQLQPDSEAGMIFPGPNGTKLEYNGLGRGNPKNYKEVK